MKLTIGIVIVFLLATLTACSQNLASWELKMAEAACVDNGGLYNITVFGGALPSTVICNNGSRFSLPAGGVNEFGRK